ncbi:MAG: hypothetical protein KF685_08760, partial [Acidobacteria bacterium]|nr:hypothetical protein [Acidobacteriota bacterium]
PYGPDNRRIFLLGSGEYHEYHEKFYLDTNPALSPSHSEKEDVCKDPESRKNVPYELLPKLGDGIFNLEFYFPIKKFDNAEDVIAGIKKNLGAVGRLPLNSAGEIVYRTEDIILVQ